MAKATIVRITRMDEKGIRVCTSKGKFFIIKSYDNGNLSIESTISFDDMTINDFAEIVAGCFEERSSFSCVYWVNFTHKGVTTQVSKAEVKNNPTEYIVNKWEKACSVN